MKLSIFKSQLINKFFFFVLRLFESPIRADIKMWHLERLSAYLIETYSKFRWIFVVLVWDLATRPMNCFRYHFHRSNHLIRSNCWCWQLSLWTCWCWSLYYLSYSCHCWHFVEYFGRWLLRNSIIVDVARINFPSHSCRFPSIPRKNRWNDKKKKKKGGKMLEPNFKRFESMYLNCCYVSIFLFFFRREKVKVIDPKKNLLVNESCQWHKFF